MSTTVQQSTVKHSRYSAYKPSGVDWLGDIPKHWKVKPLKYLTQCLDGKRVPLNAEQRGEMHGEYPYWGANGIVDYVNDWLFDEELVLLGEDGAPFFEENKDVAFFVKGKIWVNNHAHILRAISIRPRLLTYILNTVDYRAFIDGSTRDKLTQSDMGSIPIQVPVDREQDAIVTFLDRKTALIDDVIAKKQKLIKLLKEKRQALITHAVTKGLDPNTKLKPSGIDWLGDIPEGWEVKRLKYVSRFEYGDSLPDKQRNLNGHVEVYGSNGKIGYHDTPTTDGKTIIIGRKGSYGKITWVNQSCFAVDTTYFIDCRFTAHHLRWLYYLLLCLYLDEGSQDTGVPGLSRESAYSLTVPVPSLKDQSAIADFLDRETAKIDDVVAKIKSQIWKLREYKQALITNAVTGKIDVRGQ